MEEESISVIRQRLEELNTLLGFLEEEFQRVHKTINDTEVEAMREMLITWLENNLNMREILSEEKDRLEDALFSVEIIDEGEDG